MPRLAASALTIATAADARSQMRAVGSSTVYPFAKAVAERIARANPKIPAADHRIDRHRRGHEAVLRRRRRALPRRRARLAPDEGVGGQAVPVQRRHRDHRDPGRHRRPRARHRALERAQQPYPARHLHGARQDPFGKPNRAKTWKDVNGKLPAIPIRVYGPPPTSGTRDSLVELIMSPGLRDQRLRWPR